MDNKTKQEILLEAQNQIARKNFYKDWHDFKVGALGRLGGLETHMLEMVSELAMESYSQQSTKHLQDRVKELEKEARQMIYKFMLSNELANRPDGEHIIETIEKWFLNTKS